MSGNISREKEILHTGDWSMQGYVNYPGGMIYQYKVPQLIPISRFFFIWVSGEVPF